MLALIAAPMALLPAAASATIADSPFNGLDGHIDALAGAVNPDLASGSLDNSYAGGTKEDTSCPAVTAGSIPPNKDDLLGFHVATAKGQTSGDTYLYLAWTRANVLGTATMDFELNKSSDVADCNGVNAVRTAGDLLFTYDFQGGQVDAIEYRTWDGTSWGSAHNILLPGVSEGSIAADMLSGEMVIDLEAAHIFERNVCQNFAGASVKSRASSSSFTNQLKDFIGFVPKPVTNCGDLVVSKVTNGGTGTFTFHVDCDGTDYDQDVVIVNSGSQTINNIPYGTQCTVNEVANSLFTSVRTPLNGTVTIGVDPVTVSFTNTRKTGDLVITKAADAPGTFLFDVDCSDNNFDQSGVSASPGHPYRLSGIPTGTVCVVTEEANSLFSSVSVPGNGTVTIATGDNTVAFTNTRLRGDLVITKAADAPGTFLFDVDCSDNNFDQSDVSASPGHPYRLSGIPTGVSCTVTEQANPLFSSVVSPSDGTVTIVTGDNVVAFTNTRLTGALVITKAADVAGTFLFDIDCSDNSFDQTAVPASPGHPYRLAGIPSTTTCTVTEQANPLFSSTVIPGDGTVQIGTGDSTVAFTNTRLRGDLVITKAADQPGTFLFDIDCSDNAYDREGVSASPGHPYLLSGIPTTTTCTVTERDNALFTSVVVPSDGTVTIGTGVNTVAFTNTAKPNGISIDKKVNGIDTSSEDPLDVEVGSELHYTVVITNRGQVPLSISDLSDSLNADLAGSCAPDVDSMLDPTESITCSYTTTAADPAGTSIIHNVASVEGVDVFERSAGPETDETFVHVLNPVIHLDKTGPAQAHVGDTIAYTLTVTNPGNTPLSITGWADDVCDADPLLKTKQGDDNLVDPGETWVYTCSHTVVAGDPDRLVNTATVTGVDRLETEVESTDDATTQILRPAIAIAKTGTTSAHVGDAVVYTLVVTNPGNTPLANVTVSDPKCDGLPARSGADDADGLLSPGEAWTYHCTHVATAADGASILNTAKAEGTDPLGETVSNTANHTAVVLHPAITIVKTANPESVSGSGPVTYTYVVTNTGDAVLHDVVVTDDIIGAIGTLAELAPGESVTFTKTVIVDANTPPRNIGTVVGTDPLGQTVDANDDAVITVVLAAVEAQPELPRTGAPLTAETRAALALIEVGIVLTLAGRRRRNIRRAD